VFRRLGVNLSISRLVDSPIGQNCFIRVFIKKISNPFSNSHFFINFAPDLAQSLARHRATCYVALVLTQYLNTMDLLKIAEAAFASGKEMPAFKSGDTVTVSYKIIEGNKERIQQYRGVVIKIAGHGNKKRFTVRKISENVGVERIFPFDSPFIEKVEVNKIGRVRRAKLYYLRALTGKKARIKEQKAK
jgi:large subunit ribosomal protein L19